MMTPRTSHSLHRRWTLRIAYGLLIAGQATAGITTDGRVGPVQSLSGQMTIPQELGTAVGANLFHSFSTFNIDTGESATFTAVDPFDNVISRVTGGAPSYLNGRFASTIMNSAGSGANFWFINPSGVVFGPEARLNVAGSLRGSFAASTADYLTLGDCVAAPGTCGQFNATDPDASVLAVAAPRSFGFLDATIGTLQAEAAVLRVFPGATLALVAGDVTASGADLEARSGRVNIVSAAGPGEIGVDPAESAQTSVTQFGTVSLLQTSVDTDGISGITQGGRVFIRGGTIVADASTITSNHFGVATGGGIVLRASEAIELTGTTVGIANAGAGSAGSIVLEGGDVRILDGSAITSDANGAAPGPAIELLGADMEISGGSEVIAAGIVSNTGDITVRASGSVVINGAAGIGETGVISKVLPGTASNAGAVTVHADGALSLLAGGQIASQTAGSGSAGQLSVSANTILIDGEGAGDRFTGITSQTVIGTGTSSAVVVEGESISVLGGGEITSDTFAAGSAGQVSVTASTLLMDGSSAPARFTGISAGSQAGATGPAGDVTVQGDNVAILGGSAISTSTAGTGMAGDVTLTGEDILMAGAHSGLRSASTSGGADAGQAGNVTVSAGSVRMQEGSQVAATTVSGAGGAVTLNAHSIEIRDGATINVTTTGSGAAGNVLLSGPGSTLAQPARSASVVVSGPGSGVSSNTAGTGSGGAITLVAARVEISAEASISASSAVAATSPATVAGAFLPTADTTRLGPAGSIWIDATDLQVLSGGAVRTTSATSAGGNVQLQSNGTVLLDGGAISASARGLQAGDSGGNVSIARPAFLILDGGQIRADANAGPGGNIVIDTNAYVASADSIVSASSAQNVDGQITNNAENTVTDLVDLPVPTLAALAPINNRCLPDQIRNRSSLILRRARPGDIHSPYLSPPGGAMDSVALAEAGCASD